MLVCEEEGIHQSHFGSRQHFLRWETPTTFKYLEKAGLSYDTTLSYSDHAGFRCGTCYEFSVFDLGACKQLKLKERPLIAMECTVIDEKYMNLGRSMEAKHLLQLLRYRCQMFDGDFVLLWHNTRMLDKAESLMFEGIYKYKPISKIGITSEM